MSEPTPRPWNFTFFCKEDGNPIVTAGDVAETISVSVFKSDTGELWGISVPGEDPVVICYTGNGPTSKANAAHIVTCVNSHELLVEACKNANKFFRKQNHRDEPFRVPERVLILDALVDALKAAGEE